MLRVILASIVLTVSVHGKGMTVNRSDDGGNVWYVSSFGAKGDGVNKDTESLQHAIDHCAGEGGDDAIAIKSDSGRFGEVRPCEEIFVSGCILSSPPACGIRVGYEGDSPIRNCLFTNLSIHDSHHGINVISVLPDPAYPSAIYEGTKIEHIRFNQIRMERIIQPIYIWMGNEKPHLPFLGYMRDIHIADVCAVNCGNSFIGSTLPGNSIEGVSIDHVQVMAGGNAPAVRYANVWGSRHPSLLYIHNVKGLRLKRLSLCIAPDLKNWQHKLLLEDIGELICNDQITPKP